MQPRGSSIGRSVSLGRRPHLRARSITRMCVYIRQWWIRLGRTQNINVRVASQQLKARHLPYRPPQLTYAETAVAGWVAEVHVSCGADLLRSRVVNAYDGCRPTGGWFEHLVSRCSSVQ